MFKQSDQKVENVLPNPNCKSHSVHFLKMFKKSDINATLRKNVLPNPDEIPHWKS